jgi:hypothetical protein
MYALHYHTDSLTALHLYVEHHYQTIDACNGLLDATANATSQLIC